jgi:uncharacterized membrane protein YdbT with pleckstrin-like domain
MGYPERLLSPDEKVVTQFRPHWQVLIGPLGLALILVAAVVAVFAQVDPGLRVWIAIGLTAVWLLVSAKRLATWFTTNYVITNERVIARSGILSRAGKEIPLEVINDVTFNQSPFERVIRSGDLVFESAGEFGQSKYTNIPDPEAMQSLIYRLREQRMMHFRSGGVSTASEMEALARLKEQGVLSPDEFEAQKRKLLGGS